MCGCWFCFDMVREFDISIIRYIALDSAISSQVKSMSFTKAGPRPLFPAHFKMRKLYGHGGRVHEIKITDTAEITI